MLIKDVIMLLKEYNSSKTNTTLSGKGGEKASGKNYDNIITGKANSYKATEYETKYAKVFPHLGEIIKKLKSESLKGGIIVIGPALAELQTLLKGYRPKQTAEGDYTLPFGDNIRMRQQGNAISIYFNKPEDKVSPNLDISLHDKEVTK